MELTERLRKIFFVFFSGVLMILLASPSSAAQASKPIASVNGTLLVERDISEYMQRVFPAGMFHGATDPEKIQKYRESAIELMIDDELLFQKAKELGLKAKQREIKKAEKKVIERIGSEDRYEAALKSEGLSRKEFKMKLEKKILIEKTLKQEVDEKAEMSKGDVKAYYEEYKESYKRPEARRLKHILIKVDPAASSEIWEERKQKAEEVRKMIVDGADFADVAWDYSEGDYRVKGGDLGLVHRGRLYPDLETEVWKLKEGELSEAIKTIYGYHIVFVEEIIPAEQLSFEQVKDKIKTSVFEKRAKELKEELLSKLREKAEIERLDK